jgi:WD40 repeat protein
MKKNAILFVLTAALLVMLAITVQAAETKELRLVNSFDVFANKVIASADGEILLIHDSSFVLSLYSIGTGIRVELPLGRTSAMSMEQMCFSLDGSMFAVNFGSTSAAGTTGSSRIIVFDSKSGEEINEIRFNPDSFGARHVTALAFDRNNNLIAAGDNWIHIIDVKTGNVLSAINHGRHVPAVHQNPKTNHIAVRGGAGIRLYNSETGGSVKTLEFDFNVTDKAYSPNGKYLVVTGDATTVVLDAENDYRQIREINKTGRISFNKGSDVMAVGNHVYFDDDGFEKHILLADRNSDIDDRCGFLTQCGRYYLNYTFNGRTLRVLNSREITVRLREILLEPGNIDLSVGEEVNLRLIGVYSDGSRAALNMADARINISNFTVARLNGNSRVQALNAGKADLTVTHSGMTVRTTVNMREPCL